jgi:hypothetical protein
VGSIADIFAAVRLTLDGTGFEAQATALADKSGKNVGDRLSTNLSAALKTAALSAIGAGAGLMLQAVSQQAKELDAATQKLAADTGLSGDALAAQGKAIDSLYTHSLLSMDQVESTLAVVISGFGLAGQAADDLTAEFVKYEEATGQGADAVQTLKMVTDAWNLSAADSTTIMDQLVASHQQYGTVIGDMQSALQKIAPAMQAMGMSEKDGVDLLNLFASAGIDAGKASMGLQTAVKALKPGQSLNDLIVQISSIQNPLERAQAAGKVFGTRLGSQMALALQPGITSLDQFATSADTTTGASDRAAQAIQDDFGNRVTLAIRSVIGPLAELGQAAIAPLYLISMMGPKIAAAFGGLAGLLIPKIAAQLGLTLPTFLAGGTAQGAAAGGAEVAAESAAIIAGTPAVAGAVAAQGPAAAAAGARLGALIGSGLAVGIASVAVLAVGFVYNNLETELAKKADDLEAQATAWGKTATDAAIAGARAEMEAEKDNIPTIFGWDVLGGKGKVEQSIDAMTRELVARQIQGLNRSGLDAKLADLHSQLVQAMTGNPMEWDSARLNLQHELVVSMNTVQDAVNKNQEALDKGGAWAIFKPLPAAAEAATDEAVADVAKLPGEIASTIKAGREALQSDYDTLAKDLHNSLTRTQEITRIDAYLVGYALKDGLNSSDPVVQGEAQQLKLNLLARLHELGVDGAEASRIAGLTVADQLALGLTSDDGKKKVLDSMATLTGLITGTLNGKFDWAAFIKQWLTGNPAKDLGGGFVGGGSTPAPPDSRPYMRALGGPVEAGYPYLVNENTAHSEWFVPQTSGAIVPSGQMGSGRPQIIQLVVSGKVLAQVLANQTRLEGG